MLAPPFGRVKLAVLLAIAGCAAPVVDRSVPLGPDAPRLGMGKAQREALATSPGPRNGLRAPAGRIGFHLDELPPAPSMALDTEGSLLSQLGPDLDGFASGGGGEDLEAALDELPDNRVEQDGVAALTLAQLFGDTFHPGLCEDAEIEVDLEDDEGETWKASLLMPSFMHFLNEPEAVMGELPNACATAIADAGGDLDAAQADGCAEDYIRQFFPEGSDCRACVEGNGGDFDACVASEACREETPSVVWVDEGDGPVWYQMAQAYIWACAPDETVLTYLLADIAPDGTMPRPFDHAGWGYLCIPYWDDETHGVSFTCFAGEGGGALGDALGEGVITRIDEMHPKGDDTVALHRNRFAYVHSATSQNGQVLKYYWAYTPTGAGIISMPQVIPDTNGNGQVDIGDENYGFGLGGWGLNPYALRADGTDPAVLDDTLARDWLAAMALKFSTTRDGVPIHMYNRNRCADGAWGEPDADGAEVCARMDAPIDEGWLNDADNTWIDSSFTQAYALSVATIASTGLPDPDVPGGLAVHVAGSPALADPDWDDCVWPSGFTPDLAPYEDTPADFGGPASLWGDTYRFGKDPDLDIRVVLNTTQARGFCPEEE